uniref:Fibronectin type-III domain-containing protein n=1 Tax=Megaselia scalaris TaxID=36166 RepID=T1GCX5_MEGSC
MEFERYPGAMSFYISGEEKDCNINNGWTKKFTRTIPAATPENITLTFISPTSVQISWQTTADIKSIEKYLVQYKPANDRWFSNK